MQKVNYSSNPYKYDARRGIYDFISDTGTILPGNLSCAYGKSALSFFNNVTNYPWMMKDPRHCITVRTWLALLNIIPAVLFTYRHPMEVALSMSKRETEHFLISKGLRLWYIYNRMAVTQSYDLCRVITSYDRLMKSSFHELNYIYEKLGECGVPVTSRASQSDISTFVDINLQHGKIENYSCRQPVTTTPPITWPSTETYDHELYRERVKCNLAAIIWGKRKPLKVW